MSEAYFAVAVAVTMAAPSLSFFIFERRKKRHRLPKWVVPNAQALLELDAKGCLVPHGIGNHARRIIEEFIAAEKR